MTNPPQLEPAEATAGRMPLIADDVARCDGVGSDAEGWREDCEDCLRRTARRPERVVMMQPPSIITFECEYLIEPRTFLRRTRNPEHQKTLPP